MTEYAIPKGVSLDTLQDLVAGWAATGAAVEPRRTADVEDETGVTDATGRQNAFLEALDILDPTENQRHELTDQGARLARALAKDDEATARETAHDVLADWPATEQIQGLVRGNPMSRDELRPLVAAATGHELDDARVGTGVNTLLDLLEWSGHLERDDEGRFVHPAAAEASAEEAAEEAAGELESAVERVEPESAVERATPKEAVERVEEPAEGAEAAEAGEPAEPTDVLGESELPGTEAVAETEAALEPTTAAHAAETASHLPGQPATDIPELRVETGPEAVSDAVEAAGESPADAGDEAETPAESHPAEELEAELEAGTEAAVESVAEEADADRGAEGGEAAAEAPDSERNGAPPGVEPGTMEAPEEPDSGEATGAEGEVAGAEADEGEGAGVEVPAGLELVEGGRGVHLSLEAEPEVEIEPGEDGGIRIELTASPEDLELGAENGISISTPDAGGETEVGDAEAGEGGERGEAAEATEAAESESAVEAAGSTEAGDAEAGGPEAADAEPGAEAAGGEAEAADEEATGGDAEAVEAEGGATEAESGAGGADGDAEGAEAEAGGADDEGSGVEAGGDGAAGEAGGGDAAGHLHTARPGEDTLGVALDLNLDADPEQVESLVRGLKQGLTEDT